MRETVDYYSEYGREKQGLFAILSEMFLFLALAGAVPADAAPGYAVNIRRKARRYKAEGLVQGDVLRQGPGQNGIAGQGLGLVQQNTQNQIRKRRLRSKAFPA